MVKSLFPSISIPSASGLGESLLMVSALSVDTFIAAFAYGTGRIRIPLPSLLLIALTCSLTLSGSMLLGAFAGPYLPALFTKAMAFCTLVALGLYYVMVPQEPPDADKDHSKSLSLKEALFFALAMSADNAAVGVTAGFVHTNILFSSLLSLLFTLAVVAGGSVLGKKTASLSKKNHSWIGGLLLILLALSQLN